MVRKYRRFGHIELQMPVLSCGGMRYQYSWKDRPMWRIRRYNQQTLAAIIRLSIEVGINPLETARAYGKSELQLTQQ